MSTDPIALLRGIFWDEVEDALDTLDREGLTHAPAGGRPNEAAERARFDEAYRLVHSLKGAARAVGIADVEALCHTAEERLGKRQRSGELGGFEAEIAPVADALRFAVLDARAGGVTAPGKAAAAYATGRTREQMDIDLALPAQDEASDPSLAAIDSSTSLDFGGLGGPDAAPRSVTFGAFEADGGTGTGTGTGTAVLERGAQAGEETIRVPVARLGRLVRASEAVLEEIARGDEEVRALTTLEQTLLDVVVDLSKARRALRANDDDARFDAQRRIDSALEALRGLSGWSQERRTSGERSRAALTGSGREVAVEARSLRMVPFATLGPALDRAVRDASGALGKNVQLRFEHGDVELDRKVRDGLREPLLHMVRNAVDHGIEGEDERADAGKNPVGTIRIRAEVAGGELGLIVQDDGRGVDEGLLKKLAIERGVDVEDMGSRELLGLLFRAGWSTRGDVSAFSGRGVGLDVVRQRIAGLHGRVEIESTRGEGTSLRIQVPVDLSATRLVFFLLGDAKLSVVTTSVERLLRVQPADLRDVGNQLYITRQGGGDLIPLADLGATLGFSSRTFAQRIDAALSCIVLTAGDRRLAIVVDALLDERDAVVIPLGNRVRSAPFVLGATLLSDGEMCLVLDADELTSAAVRATRETEGDATGARARQRRVLLADDSVTTLQLERTLLESAGFEVVTASDGEQAWAQLQAGPAFDVLVSDIEMPKLDGLSLSARVRRDRAFATLPIVLVTGLAQDEQRRRALEIGVNAYIVKGRFDEDELIGVLEQLT